VYHGALKIALHGGLGMDRWDVIIILVAGYVAIMSLVRLMARRRNQALEQIHGQISELQGKKKNKIDQPSQNDRGAA
jgi:hypothetical protein